MVGGAATTAAVGVDAPTLVAAERREAVAKQADPDVLIPMGRGERPFHLGVMLNTHGASVQQVVLNDHQEADREGLPVTNEDGTPKPLHLIPGVTVPRTPKMRDQRQVPVPKLSPGKVTLKPTELAHPSYVMNHYDKENDERPVDILGTRQWTLVRSGPVSEDADEVAFETELGAPHFLKITKTYTLFRNDYHVGLAITLTPTRGRPGPPPSRSATRSTGPGTCRSRGSGTRPRTARGLSATRARGPWKCRRRSATRRGATGTRAGTASRSSTPRS